MRSATRSRAWMVSLGVVASLILGGGTPEPPQDRVVDRVVGRVLDVSGQPVEGATIWFVPDRDTIAWMGLDQSVVSARRQPVPLERLARVTTGAEGAFSIESHRRRDPARITTLNGLREPRLTVLHSLYAPVTVDCPAPGTDGVRRLEVVMRTGGATLIARVVDENGAAVPGAEVSVRSGDGTFGWRDSVGHTLESPLRFVVELQLVRTDEAGRVSIPGLAPGLSSLRVEEPTHSWVERKGIRLTENATLDLGDIVAPTRLHRLQGRVVDEEGQPIAGADVTVADGWIDLPTNHAELHRLPLDILSNSSYRHTLVAHSGADGGFDAGSVDSPTATVVAEASGYEPGLVKACVPAQGPVTITLVRKRPFVVRVRDARTDRAVMGARVLAADQAPWLESYSHYLDRTTPARCVAVDLGDGQPRFEVDGCAEPLLLTLEAPGYATDTFAVITPTLGAEAEIALMQEATISGRAVDAGGRPLEGVEVNLRGERFWLMNAWKGPPGWHGPQWTGPDGSFRVTGLASGEWELLLTSPGRARPATKLVLEPNDALALGDLIVPRHGRIAGRVVLADGVPGAGFRVSAGNGTVYGMGGGRAATADGEGRFEFDGLTPGQWRLHAQVSDKCILGEHVDVELGDGEAVDVDVPGVRGPRVFGRVLAGGQPVAGARFAIHDRTEQPDYWTVYDWAPSAEDGSFDLEYWDAEAQELIAIAPWGGSSTAITTPSDWNEALSADLQLGESSMAGVVRTEVDGRALPGIEVELLGPWWDGYVEPLVTDAEGRFRFEHLGAHDYRIRCVDPSAEHATVELGPWPVGDRESREGLDLRVPRSAELTVIVGWGDGGLAPNGSRVYLFAVGAENPAREGGLVGGRTTFDRLAPGTYTAAVGSTRSGCWGAGPAEDRASQILELDPGEHREIRLDHPPR